MTPVTLCSLREMLRFSKCFHIYWPVLTSHKVLPRPDIITPILQMRRLLKGGERFAQDEYGPLRLEEVLCPPEVPWVRASRSGPQLGLVGDLHPRHTHTCQRPTRGDCQARTLWHSIHPGTAKRWQAAAVKAFPPLDPCLHCRIFTRRREGGEVYDLI